MVSMASERTVLGSVYRLTAEFLAQRELTSQLLPRVSPETRAILEKPPFAFGWKSAKALEEIERVLYTLPNGRDLCVELGTAATLNLCGSVINGVVKMSFTLFGQTPATMFANANRFFQVVTTGIDFRYEVATANTGVMWANITGGEAHTSLFDQIRGNLKGAYALCSVKGEVGAPEVFSQGPKTAVVKYALRWE